MADEAPPSYSEDYGGGEQPAGSSSGGGGNMKVEVQYFKSLEGILRIVAIVRLGWLGSFFLNNSPKLV